MHFEKIKGCGGIKQFCLVLLVGFRSWGTRVLFGDLVMWPGVLLDEICIYIYLFIYDLHIHLCNDMYIAFLLISWGWYVLYSKPILYKWDEYMQCATYPATSGSVVTSQFVQDLKETVWLYVEMIPPSYTSSPCHPWDWYIYLLLVDFWW